MRTGPNPRYISNRIFQDLFVNVPDEHRISQYGFTWGQFIAHDIGLAQVGDVSDNIPFDPNDPLENFTNDLGIIPFNLDQTAEGTGTEDTPREFINTVSAYLDGSVIYGPSTSIDGISRVDRLRDPNDRAKLSVNTIEGKDYLPFASTVGIDDMEQKGRLRGNPEATRAAGDIRANEFLGLTSLQTLFVREHNRVVDLLDANAQTQNLSADEKFELARTIVVAEQQAITYNEYLPAFGINLPTYTGYDSSVNAQLSNEFAVVGFRAHSQIHGDIVAVIDPGEASAEQLTSLASQGVTVTDQPDGSTKLQVPTNVAFFNPDLVESVGLDNVFRGLNVGPEYRNDEQIDNQIRSLLFQLPNQNFDPTALDGTSSVQQFSGVIDLSAIDIKRAREHGVSGYNDLREAYGLSRITSFTEITGEPTDELPPGTNIDDPAIINWLDEARQEVSPENAAAQLNPVDATLPPPLRKSTVAARLKAIYQSVDNIDAFVGMLAEKHLPYSSFGPLQKAIWQDQFLRLREGDRFFYENLVQNDILSESADGQLSIAGIPILDSLSDVITANTSLDDGDLSENVFFLSGTILEGTSGADVLKGDAENNRLLGLEGDDRLKGRAGRDIIDGDRGNDQLYGGKGDDELLGGTGDDRLYGNRGNDLLWGGSGNDFLRGGRGQDTFVLAPGEGKNIIADFNPGTDLIGLMGSLSYGDLEFRGRNIFVSSTTQELLAKVKGFHTSDLTSTDFTTL